MYVNSISKRGQKKVVALSRKKRNNYLKPIPTVDPEAGLKM